jgi:hypothetical protein
MTQMWQQKWKEKGLGSFSKAPTKELLRHFQVLWESEQNKTMLDESMQSHSDQRKRDYKGDGSSTQGKRSRGNGGGKSNTNKSNTSKSGDHDKFKGEACKYHNGVHSWTACFGNTNGKKTISLTSSSRRLESGSKGPPRAQRRPSYAVRPPQGQSENESERSTTPDHDDMMHDHGESHWTDKIQ